MPIAKNQLRVERPECVEATRVKVIGSTKKNGNTLKKLNTDRVNR